MPRPQIFYRSLILDSRSFILNLSIIGLFSRGALAKRIDMRFLRKFGALALATGVAATATGRVALADDTGLASIHDLRREGGRLCMSDHFHYGSGTGPTRAAAQRDAIGSWSSFTAMEYGSDWARWGRSGSKAVSCNKDSSGYSCSLSARPCK
jgi:hypothetical protein